MSQFNHLMSWKMTRAHLNWKQTLVSLGRCQKHLSFQYIDNCSGFSLIPSSDFFFFLSTGRSITSTSNLFIWEYLLSVYLNRTPLHHQSAKIFLREIQMWGCRAQQRGCAGDKAQKEIWSCLTSLSAQYNPTLPSQLFGANA